MDTFLLIFTKIINFFLNSRVLKITCYCFITICDDMKELGTVSLNFCMYIM